MIVDAVEHVGQPGLRIGTNHLRGLDERYGAGQSFPAAVGSCEEPVFPTDPDRAYGPLGRIFVDADAPVLQEECKGGPAGHPIPEGLGQIALSRNARKLGLNPRLEGPDQESGVLLTRRLAQLGGLTGDLLFSVAEFAVPVGGLPYDLRPARLPDIMEVTPQMRPSRRLPEHWLLPSALGS
ncbi:hypothetical protein RA26_08210 [Leisingera sp. ANG-M7]|nr:hypothetical protein RA26_08210 [Leisingera sp. ANG-M7]